MIPSLCPEILMELQYLSTIVQFWKMHVLKFVC